MTRAPRTPRRSPGTAAPTPPPARPPGGPRRRRTPSHRGAAPLTGAWSSRGRDADRAGVAPDDVHLDHASGAKASRPQLDLVLKLLRSGDTLVVTRLDRLGRSVLHLVTLGAALRERGVGLRVIEQGIDTSTAEGRAMFGMLSVLAEFERDLIRERTSAGLAAARARGRKGGRPTVMTPAKAAAARRTHT